MKARNRLFSIIALVCLLVSSCGPAITSTPPEPSPSASLPATTVTPLPALTEPALTPSPTPLVVEFTSTGDLKEGWYWLRDNEMKADVQWTLSDLPPEPADINLKLSALVTDQSQTAGLPATFTLSYGSLTAAGKPLELGQQTVYLPNLSPQDDSLGFLCAGNTSLARSTIPSGVTNLWVKASRLAEGENGLPGETLLAFRPESLELIGGSLPAEMINLSVYQGGDFSSDGDYINGWWWLRDFAHTASATWNFASLPPGSSDLDINFEVLATDQANGGPGFDASFYVSYGPIPDSRPTGEIPSVLVTLPNAHLENDPTGYTCRGKFTIPRADLPTDTQAIWMRISRLDALGQNPVDLHIAFMQTSVTFGEGPTTTRDSQSWEDAITVTNGDYSNSLDFQDTQDWYKIQLGPKDFLEVGLTYPQGADFEFALFDPAMNEIGSPIQDGADRIVLAHIAAQDAAGTWYIKVYPPSGIGAYVLHIATRSQNEANTGRDAPDTRNPDSILTAGSYPGLVMPADPVDYYAFDLDPGQTVNFELTNAFQSTDAWSGSTIFKVEIRSYAGALLKQGLTQDGILTISAANIDAIPVRRFISVRADSGRGGAYNLSLTRAGNLPCPGATQAADFYTSAVASPDGLSLQNQTNANDGSLIYRTTDATWLFRSLPSGTGNLLFSANLPLNYDPINTAGVLQGKFYVLYGPIPAQPGGSVFGPLTVTLNNISDPTTSSGILGRAEFSLPRADLQNASQGFWIRIYRENPVDDSLWEPAYTTLGVSKPAIQLCLGDQEAVSTSAPAAHPQASVTLDAATQILTSNTPIFVDPGSDMDGDGLNQNWENAAADRVNPVIEVDEEELWLQHRSEHHVVNFVRVYPWPSIQNPKFIIFAFLETWSRDYGSGAQNDIYEYVKERHDGDSEMIYEAWRVLDGNRVALEWVHTSAHYGATDHSGVWHVRDQQCNVGNISDRYRNFIATEMMCGKMEIELPSGRLKVYTAENKHGIYPSDAICNNVHLVYMTLDPHIPGGAYWGENCGFDPSGVFQWSNSDFNADPRYLSDGKWMWTVFNVGEPDNFLINDLDTPSEWRGLTDAKITELTGAFPDEAIWDGHDLVKRSQFCGGLQSIDISNLDIPISYPNCSSRIGSKYENSIYGYGETFRLTPATPLLLSSKLKTEYKITIHTVWGMGGTAAIQVWNDVGDLLAYPVVKGTFLNGQTDIFYADPVPTNRTRNIDHVIFTLIQKGSGLFPIPWFVSSIDVTDLVQNVNTNFPVNRVINLNEPVTLTLPLP
jgi:hypothetical protein